MPAGGRPPQPYVVPEVGQGRGQRAGDVGQTTRLDEGNGLRDAIEDLHSEPLIARVIGSVNSGAPLPSRVPPSSRPRPRHPAAGRPERGRAPGSSPPM